MSEDRLMIVTARKFRFTSGRQDGKRTVQLHNATLGDIQLLPWRAIVTDLVESMGDSATDWPQPHTGSIVIVDQRKSACDILSATIAPVPASRSYEVDPHGCHR